MIPRPCLDCGRLGPDTRCQDCRKAAERIRSRERGARPHYAGDYRKRAAEIRATATVCWVCGEGPRPDDPWQADHLVAGDPTSPLAAAHRSCNIRRANAERARGAGGRG